MALIDSPTVATARPEEFGGTNGTRRLEADANCVKVDAWRTLLASDSDAGSVGHGWRRALTRRLAPARPWGPAIFGRPGRGRRRIPRWRECRRRRAAVWRGE